jgi:hypothetical protein
MPGKTYSAPCHVFALFSTGVGQKTVDNSNPKPTIYGTADKARPSKDGVAERNSSPFPRKTSFDAIGVVLLPPKAAPKGREKGLVRGSRLKIGLRRIRRAGIAEIVGVRRSQDPPAPAVVA